MAGILVSMDWRVTLVCAALFLGAVIITRYVSLGSILVVISFFIQILVYGRMEHLPSLRIISWSFMPLPSS